MKREDIILDCGISAERTTSRKVETLEIDISDLYYNPNKKTDYRVYGEMLIELSDKGYSNQGMYINSGPYGEVEGLTLTMQKDIK